MQPTWRDHHATAANDGILHVHTTDMRCKSTQSNPWESHVIPIHLGETLVGFRQRLLQALKPSFDNKNNYDGVSEETSVVIVAVNSDHQVLLFNDAMVKDKVGRHDNNGRKSHQASNFHQLASRENQTLAELGILPRSHVYAFPSSTAEHFDGAATLHLKFVPPNQPEAISIQVPSLFVPCILLKILLVHHQQNERQLALSNESSSGGENDMDIDDTRDNKLSESLVGPHTDGNSMERIRLIFAGKQLEDYRRCVDYSISKDATIFVVLRAS